MLVLPFTADPAQRFTTQLGDIGQFTFDARYNDRAAYWTFDLTSEPDQTVLVAGVPILIGQDILAPYGLGRGGIFATDDSGAELDAGPEDLGDRVSVIWLSPDELEAIRQEGIQL